VSAGPGERLVEIARGDVGRNDAAAFRTAGGSNWCMYFVSDVLARAGLEAPGDDERARRGALAGVRWVASRGIYVCSPARAAELLRRDDPRLWRELADELRPGDVAAWRRSRLPLEWRGHVALVERVEHRERRPPLVHGLGGNEGGRVRQSAQEVRAWARKLPGGLYAVARYGAERPG
jgi:hypothetical protein